MKFQIEQWAILENLAKLIDSKSRLYHAEFQAYVETNALKAVCISHPR